jgi:hypothetical protein
MVHLCSAQVIIQSHFDWRDTKTRSLRQYKLALSLKVAFGILTVDAAENGRGLVQLSQEAIKTGKELKLSLYIQLSAR